MTDASRRRIENLIITDRAIPTEALAGMHRSHTMTAPPSMTLMDAVRSIVSHCPTDEARAAINWYDALIDRLQAAEQALLSRPDRPVRSQDFLDGIHEAIRVYRTAAEAAAKGAQT